MRHAVTVALTAVLAMLAPATADAAGADEVLIQNADGRWERFWVRDSDRSLMHRWQRADGSWSRGRSLGGVLKHDKIDVGRNADGRLEVFGIGTDDQVHHIWQRSSGGWSRWSGMGGRFLDTPDVGYTGSRMIVYGEGSDHRVYRRHQTAANCCWTSTWVPV